MHEGTWDEVGWVCWVWLGMFGCSWVGCERVRSDEKGRKTLDMFEGAKRDAV